MKGDFTRDTFDRFQHFNRVLMQQGRVQLDADFNEQVTILLHYFRTAMRDLLGPYGGPADACGFEIIFDADKTLLIKPGRYYVNGILCENEKVLTYVDQEGFKDMTPPQADMNYYVYLDVWERHITWIQDERIRESALGGPDTCTRSKIVWQVRLHESPSELTCDGLNAWLSELPRLGDGQLRARVHPGPVDTSPCTLPPESRYRGTENQLYRIEIHRGGPAWNGLVDKKGNPKGNAAEAATFTWSRDNGSVVFPIVRQEGAVVTLESLGRDQRTGLTAGDWVEIMDDTIELQGMPGILAQVDVLDPVELTVTLKLPADAAAAWPAYDEKTTTHPLLRRWDHAAQEGVVLSQGAILIGESDDPESGWIAIEDGIEIQFRPHKTAAEANLLISKAYRTGDYWLVPARVATGTIEWPEDPATGTEKWERPHGVEHNYAPLAVIQAKVPQPRDCRCHIGHLVCREDM